ncbi:MAG: DUF4150 domain-containing protein [Polyangiaceae bacterium]
MADVFANNRQILHSGDGLTQVSGPPDVCKTPSPGGPVPIPYPNAAMDSDLASGTKKVKINGNPVAIEPSNLSTSTGDEAGTAGGGVASNTTKGKLTWGGSSGDVVAEGSGVVRFMEVTQHNGNLWNTVLAALGEPAVVSWGDDPLDSKNCAVCTKPKDKHRVDSSKDIADLAQKIADEMRKKGGSFESAFKTPGQPAKQGKKGPIAAVPGGALKKGVMIGVLDCACGTNTYAGLAGEKYDDGAYKASANAFKSIVQTFQNGKGNTLIPVVDTPSPPVKTGNVAPSSAGGGFGAIGDSTWSGLRDLTKNGTTPEGAQRYIGNVPLTCAAPKMIQKSLDAGHKPKKLIEIWVAMKQGKTVEIAEVQHVVWDGGVPIQRTWIPDVPFGDGAAVVSCPTCQVLLTPMLCKLDEPPCP